MRRLAAPAVAALILLGLAAGGAFTLSRLEEHDTFCISCHTAPEMTYFERAQAASAGQALYSDLSSAHYGRAPSTSELMAIRCIDCHRGDGGPVHRAVTLTLGARDAWIWISGQSNPTIEKTELVVPLLLTAACVECHADALLVMGFNNHFHNRLPQAARARMAGGELRPPEDASGFTGVDALIEPIETGVQCVDCHRAHIHVEGSERTAYLDLVNNVYPTCVRCHEEVGHGPLELAGR